MSVTVVSPQPMANWFIKSINKSLMGPELDLMVQGYNQFSDPIYRAEVENSLRQLFHEVISDSQTTLDGLSNQIKDLYKELSELIANRERKRYVKWMIKCHLHLSVWLNQRYVKYASDFNRDLTKLNRIRNFYLGLQKSTINEEERLTKEGIIHKNFGRPIRDLSQKISELTSNQTEWQANLEMAQTGFDNAPMLLTRFLDGRRRSLIEEGSHFSQLKTPALAEKTRGVTNQETMVVNMEDEVCPQMPTATQMNNDPIQIAKQMKEKVQAFEKRLKSEKPESLLCEFTNLGKEVLQAKKTQDKDTGFINPIYDGSIQCLVSIGFLLKLQAKGNMVEMLEVMVKQAASANPPAAPSIGVATTSTNPEIEALSNSSAPKP